MFVRKLAVILGSALSVTTALSSAQPTAEIRFQQGMESQDNNFLDPVAKHHRNNSRNDKNADSNSVYGQLQLAYDNPNSTVIAINTEFSEQNPSVASFVPAPLTQVDPSSNILFPSAGVVEVVKDGVYLINYELQGDSNSGYLVIGAIYTPVSSGVPQLLLNTLINYKNKFCSGVNQIIRMSAGDRIEFAVSNKATSNFGLVNGSASIVLVGN